MLTRGKTTSFLPLLLGAFLWREARFFVSDMTRRFDDERALLQYPITLRSLTHGEGHFTKQFAHYAPVPDNAAKPLIEDYQKRRETNGH